MKICEAGRSAGYVTAVTTVLIKHEIFSWINLCNRPNEENRNISLFLPGNFSLCHSDDNVSAKKHGMFFREQWKLIGLLTVAPLEIDYHYLRWSPY